MKLNHTATCSGDLPATMRVAPRDLLVDLARLAEMLLDPTKLERAARLVDVIREEALEMPRLSGDDACGFEGDVDADFRHDNAYWHCPRCGTENIDDMREVTC